MNKINKLTAILSKLDTDELEELLNIVKENKTNQDNDVITLNRKGRFSMKEIDFLSEYYPKHGAEWCGSHLGRTLVSIIKKAEKLGLSFIEPVQSIEDPDIFHPTKIYPTPMDTKTPRQNLFLNYKPTKKEKTELDKDIIIDQLLSKDLIPISRGNRPSNMISIVCSVCGRKNRVNNKIVGNVERFKCNKCMIKGR